MKPGDQFNPWSGSCGFYPAQLVGRQRNLRAGPKLVYERLVRFAGRDGLCFPSHQKLADELGKSLAQVKRDIATLERAGLISHEFRNGRRSNTYRFLWHPCFDAAAMSSHGFSEGAQTHPQSPRREPSRQLTSDGLKAHEPARNYRQNHRAETSSSSSRQSNVDENFELKTTKKADSSGKETSQPGKKWWSGQDSAGAVGLLRGANVNLPDPDPSLVAPILSHMESLEDLRQWLQSNRSLLASATSRGLFVTDARRWPDKPKACI